MDQRHVALPADHGSWALMLAPLAIGFFVGGRWSVVCLYLIVAVLCAFLVRQPLTLGVKAYSGRRSRDVLPAVRLWVGIYTFIGLLHVTGLVLRGFSYLLWLAVPGVPVFLWHLYLVARRKERRQWLVETFAAGALALGAPAGYWVGIGEPDPTGWLLWILCWGQSASWIAHVYLRLGQRSGETSTKWASPTIALLTLAVALIAGLLGLLPRLLWLAFLVQGVESVRGVVAPAAQAKPRAVGLRQLLLSVVQTVLFIVLMG